MGPESRRISDFDRVLCAEFGRLFLAVLGPTPELLAEDPPTPAGIAELGMPVGVTRRGADVLIGQGHELQGHHMEIRGLGVIDVGALFGIRAIRTQKRLEVIVQLEHWVDGKEYTRTGLDTSDTVVLDVRIPTVTIPLNPGKNITVIAEVIAMNHLLKYSGIDTAAAFDERLKDAMQPAKAYLEQDYE